MKRWVCPTCQKQQLAAANLTALRSAHRTEALRKETLMTRKLESTNPHAVGMLMTRFAEVLAEAEEAAAGIPGHEDVVLEAALRTTLLASVAKRLTREQAVEEFRKIWDMDHEWAVKMRDARSN
jgi:hypothetical protein